MADGEESKISAPESNNGVSSTPHPAPRRINIPLSLHPINVYGVLRPGITRLSTKSTRQLSLVNTRAFQNGVVEEAEEGGGLFLQKAPRVGRVSWSARARARSFARSRKNC